MKERSKFLHMQDNDNDDPKISFAILCKLKIVDQLFNNIIRARTLDIYRRNKPKGTTEKNKDSI